jgi:hypothetical protein
MASPKPVRALAYAWVAVLSVVVVGPALGPGFALSYDLVFTPRQDLLPGSIGVGGGLPRAAPQDAVVALVEMVVPGGVLEKLILLGIPLLVGAGMLRLLPGTAVGVVAATFAIANPFVAQRLVIGHWGFLLAYALVPWGLIVARRLRASGDPWDGVRLVLLVAAGSLTPSGSLLMSALVVPPALLPASAYSLGRRVLLVAAVWATWLPWLLPALIHPARDLGDPAGTAVFGLRPDAPGGALVSALTGGGIWNAEIVLPSRGSALTWLFAVAALGLAAWGAPRLPRILGRATVTWWACVAVVGLAAAVASVLAPGPWSWLLDIVPGGGLARDAHKLLAPWVLLLAAAAGVGAGRLAGLPRDRSTRVVIAVAVVMVPIAAQPDMLWGAGGRLAAVEYPGDWQRAREVVQADAGPGDVVSFPWTAFRRFDWNPGRTVLDPAPRWMPRATVVADSLEVLTPSGLIAVQGDDPRAGRISQALESGSDVTTLLPDLGITWALVALDTPGVVPELPGWTRLVDGDSLELYAAPERGGAMHYEGVRLVGTVDALIATALAAALGLLLIRGFRRVRSRRR